MAIDLSVVMPVLDEEASLRSLLPALNHELLRLGIISELLLVDGGSRDRTQLVAREHGATVLSQQRPGFGAAYAVGMERARGEFVLTMDGDGSHGVGDLERLWARRRDADVVIASRFVPGGAASMPRLRYWASRLLNAITRRGLGLPARDASSGYRLYRRASIEGLRPEARDFSVQQEMLARVLARGGSFVEVPFSYLPRVGGQSKASFIRFASSYLKVFRLVWRLRRESKSYTAARS